MERTVLNEWGEPIGTEYVPTQYEEEIAYFEEMDRRAEDPFYAASKELEAWHAAACRAFDAQGIHVPYDVEMALAREMKKKSLKIKEAKALAEAKPVVDFLNKIFPDGDAYANYYPETADEWGYVEIDFHGKTPTKEEMKGAIALGYERDLYVEDYIYWGMFK